jgi:hypothetical protein
MKPACNEGGMFGIDLGDWQLLADIIMMAVAFIGGIIMFFDASMRLNGPLAFALAAIHGITFLLWRFPAVVVLYFFYWLLCEYMDNRKLPEDELPRFGLRQATGDPVGEAAKLGLPSVLPGKGNNEYLSRADEIPELELMLAKGDIAGAVKFAEAELKAAEASGDVERSNVLKKYVLRLQRGKY